MSQARQQGIVAALLLPHLPTVYEAQAWFLPWGGLAVLCRPEESIAADWLAPELHHTTLVTRRACSESQQPLWDFTGLIIRSGPGQLSV